MFRYFVLRIKIVFAMVLDLSNVHDTAIVLFQLSPLSTRMG